MALKKYRCKRCGLLRRILHVYPHTEKDPVHCFSWRCADRPRMLVES